MELVHVLVNPSNCLSCQYTLEHMSGDLTGFQRDVEEGYGYFLHMT